MKASVLRPAAIIAAIVLNSLIPSNPARAGDCLTFNFVATGQFAAGATPLSVVVGDFNVDGKADLAVANQMSANVSILLGKGDGTFHAATNYAVGTAPSSVALGYINSDNNLDLAVADFGDRVHVLLGAGNGTFQTTTNYGTGTNSNPSSVALGNFNADPNADLAVANRGSDNVSVLLGNGNGTLQPLINYDAGANPSSVASGDFNGDNKTDLVVANAAVFSAPPGVSVLLGAGNGTFGNAANYAAGASPRSVVVGDFNKDGRPDLAIANFEAGTNNSVMVLLGNANGTFQAAVNYAAGMGSVSVAVADFNADTNLDLAVANNSSGTVSVLLGNGNGTFQSPLNFSAGGLPTAVAIADFNNDGKPDLAALNNAGVLTLLQTTNQTVLVGLPVLTLSLQCLADVPPVPTVTACDSNVPVTFTSNESGTPCNMTITRTWSATDPSSNTVSFTQTITVHDDTNPILGLGTIAISYATIAEAEAAALAATSASDNCSTVTKTASTAGNCTNVVVTVVGTDACGNQQSVSYNTHIDVTPPILSGLPAATLTLQCTGDVPPPPTVTATDNCEGSVPVTFTPSQTGAACNRTITRTWSAMDTSGNMVSFTQTITVHDTTNPMLTKGTIAAAYQTAAAAETAARVATTASDNCSTVTKTASTVGTCTAVITVTGTDACGNEQSVTYNTRIDNTSPVLSGLPPATLTVQCPDDVPALPTVTAADNCAGTVPVTSTTNQTGSACNRIITRTWSATDTASNTVTFTQTITVHDTTSPTLTKGTIAASYQTAGAAEAAALAATTASDNCSTVTKAASTVGTCAAVVTVTGTDACGNQQSVSYNTRIDATPPVFHSLPPATLAVQCLADVPVTPTVTATDNCDTNVTVTYTSSQAGTTCNMTITRAWSAVDTSGNLASFTQTITVHDTTGPSLTKGTIASGYQTVAEAEAAALAATSASDNCDGTVTKSVSTGGTCPAVVTVTGTDACGNQQSVSYNLSINNAPPVLSGLPAPSVSVQCLVNVPTAPTVTAMDDCNGPRPVTYTTNQSGTACNLNITRTWSAMDASGNTASFTQTIVVHDDTSPILIKGSISTNYLTVAAAEAAALAATTASDNCSNVALTASTVGECPATITVMGTDACGNQESVTYSTCISSAVSLAIRRSGSNVIVSWPMPSTGFVLESTTSLRTPNWQPVGEVPVANNGRWDVTASVGEQQRYFRLHKQ